jgi:hypothetical protein
MTTIVRDVFEECRDGACHRWMAGNDVAARVLQHQRIDERSRQQSRFVGRDDRVATADHVNRWDAERAGEEIVRFGGVALEASDHHSEFEPDFVVRVAGAGLLEACQQSRQRRPG